MKIEMNTIYHLPTQAHEDDFLKQAWLQGYNATEVRKWRDEIYCVRTDHHNSAGHDKKGFYERVYPQLPIIEWKIGFTKKDMQIGQAYKMKNGVKLDWDKSDIDYYTDDLKCKDGSPQYDVVEVYHFSLTPIWKREEPKYRVKTELTKEQAEKLGLEFCEVVE